MVRRVFESRRLQTPSGILPPPRNLSDLQFFRDRVSLAIEQDRLEKSLGDLAFEGFTERTVTTARAGDVTAVMRDVTDEEEARRFVCGYIEDLLVEEGTSGRTTARETVLENLRLGAGKSFSDEKDRSRLGLWSMVLSSYQK